MTSEAGGRDCSSWWRRDDDMLSNDNDVCQPCVATIHEFIIRSRCSAQTCEVRCAQGDCVDCGLAACTVSYDIRLMKK